MELRVEAEFREHTGTLSCGNARYPCALGPAGLVSDKAEGDGGTPIARMALKSVFFRADRISAPDTKLPIKAITPHDAWCDDPGSSFYNSPVQLPFSHGHEKMWLEENVYDICVILDWNLSPALADKGSAIFFHLARQAYTPTEGCIAVSESDMRSILAVCDEQSTLETVLVTSAR
ncbi:L,D-transpeptidase [Parvularcula sp. IMCC14364]|uniref:L,D-transpeptidase family protein n=1 Tax=Parvularcula sp. IMCC14364 TaxID=3067902 RepID=UPI002740682E|nr:L,D-transpeptidase family protein [Parvularcula sp. IMCC14364]